jgi:hypothetical protein
MKTMDLTDLIELMENAIVELKELNKPKKWRAKQGEIFFYVNHFLVVKESTEIGTNVDFLLYESGNYFQTEAECREFCEKVKALLR